jgi:pyruvate-formate lyase-activating enzyme
MSKKKPLYCYQAMQGVSITSDGRARPCCVVSPRFDLYTYTTRYDNEKHKNLAPPHRKYEVAETFKDFVNAEFLKSVRTQLRNGEWPDICRSCQKMEEAGLKSYRQSHNDMNKDHIDYDFEKMEEDGSVTEDAIEYLDITLGNQCNLKCRSCNPYCSHSWIEESKQVEFEETKWNLFSFQHIERTSNDPWYKYSFENDYFTNALPNLKGINFIGGEPLVVKEHYDWLEKIVDSGHAKNIHLTYNTNGTTIPDTLLDLWENFKSINIGLSVDAYGDLAYYVRFPSKWKNIERNSQKLADYAQSRGLLTVHLHTTISLLNIHDLPQLLSWSMNNFKKRNFYSSELGYNIGFQKLIPSFNMVTEPTYLNVCHLPDEQKEVVNAMLDEQYDFYKKTDLVPDWAKFSVEDILNLKTYVNQPRDEKQWQAFLINTKRSDKFRGVDILDYIPWMEKYIDK